jgi:hypothetical protein
MACPSSASSCSTNTSVDGPVAVRFFTGSCSFSNSTCRSCRFELMLNSTPASS